MPLGKGQRRVLRIAGFTGVALVGLWTLLPLWFPWVLRPLASRQSISYDSCRRAGFSHFVLENTRYSDRFVRIQAGHIELRTPGSWLWQRLLHGPRSEKNIIRVSDWTVNLLSPKQPDAKGGGPTSTYTNVTGLFPILRQVNRWAPFAALSNGTLEGSGFLLKFPFANLTNGTVTAKLEWPKQAWVADVLAAVDPSGKISLEAASASLNDRLALTASRDDGGIHLEATNFWGSNAFRMQARFGRVGQLPEAATLDSDSFSFPAKMLDLPGYETVSSTLHGNWGNDQFALEVAGDAKPLPGETNFPAASLRLRTVGNTREATIESAKLTSAWLTADLSKELHVYFSGPLLRDQARLTVAADLNNQTLLAASGIFRGTVDFDPETGKLPRAEFKLDGTDIGSHSWTAQTVSLKGNLNWPWLSLDESKAALPGGSTAMVSGRFDLRDRIFDGVHATIKGTFARRFLPPGTDCESVVADVRLDGPIKAVQHSGSLQISHFTQPEIQPLDAALKWKGVGKNFQDFEVAVNAGATVCNLAGSLEVQARGVNGSLRQVSLRSNTAPILELKSPASFAFEFPSGNRFQARVEGFHLTGTAGAADLSADMNWPERGSISLGARAISSGFLKEILITPLKETRIDQLSVAAGWTNGPLTFEVSAQARQSAAFDLKSISGLARLNEFGLLSLSVGLKGDANGLSISNLLLTSETSQVITAQGSLPITFDPGSNALHFMREKPLGFSAHTDPDSVFWTKLSDRTGIVLSKPRLQVNLAGSWAAPLGTMSLKANAVDIPKWHGKLPAISDLNLEMALNRASAWLTNCQILVQGQPVRFSGEMPLGESFWRDAEQRKLPDFERASGNLLIDKADLGAFADLFPTLLSPQGELSADISLLPGGNLQGNLTVQNGRTRPLPNIGPLRDVELELKFQQRTVQLASASLRIGSSTVTAQGQGDLRGTEWMKGITPPFEFFLHGTNVPLSREPSSIIRADLDLSVEKSSQEPPLVSGEVRVLNSYFLSDLRALVPARTASVARRPPYFSIEDPELSRWRLSLRVIGERGVKVRTTLFVGEVGPNLRVQGTLRDPIATGDVKIGTGQVRLPFAALDVQQGFVTLTSEDPYRPRLQVTAASKRFGYDVRMEISGPADEPVIQFTSTPPLSSEQLLLMLSAGELPRGNYTLSPQQRAQTVALFLGKDLLAKLGFGDQGGQRLTYSSGENISETGKPTYDIDYKLTERWSLEGEYDRFNAFNAGLKWKVYSK